MNTRGWSPPYLLIIIVIIGILTLIFGWKTLIYVAALFFGITLCVWIYDKVTGGPQEVIEEADSPVVPEGKDGELVPADAPAMTAVDEEESMPVDSPELEEEPLSDSTSTAAEILGIIVFFGAILFCLAFPSFALGMWGPWGGIVAALACGGLWIAFGPPPFPGLLPGFLAIMIPLNALVIILISIYKLIWN